MKKKLLVFSILVMVFTLLLTSTVSAFAPYETYTYSSEGTALASPAAYSAEYIIDAKQMSTSDITVTLDTTSRLSDLCTDNRGWVYIADQGADQIIALNQDYKVQYVIKEFNSDLKRGDTFDSPRGIFASDYYLYVCDTNKERIVMFDLQNGEYVKTVNAPQTNYFQGEDAKYGFMPVSCAADRYGRLFVISISCNQGVIIMDDDGNFTGFMGAQKVTYSAFEMFFRKFESEEESKSRIQNVAINLDRICLEHGTYGDFVFAVTTSIDTSSQEAAITSKNADYSPVKKLNTNGDEIMKRNGFFDCGGEVNVKGLSLSSTKSGVSKVSDVATGPEGSWSIIDSKRSKVFTYDANGQLLYAFGDDAEQSQLGSITNLVAMDYQYYEANDTYNLLLLDSTTSSFTVFSRTDYGDLLIEALHNDNERQYSRSLEYWYKILEANNNFDVAYIGIGRSLYYNGQYDEALEYLSAAKETTIYAETLKTQNQDRLVKYPILALVYVAVGIILLVLFLKLMGYAKKLNKEGNYKKKHTFWEELMYGFYVPFHPFDGFWDIKHEKRGTVRGGLTILLINSVAAYYQVIGQSYLSNPTEKYSSFISQLLGVTVPVLLWAISNWCLTTLFDGEAKFKDVFVASCYALAPLPWFLVISTIATNLSTTVGDNIVTLITTIGYVWVGFLIFFGTLVVQDYSFGKNVVTSVGTIICMAVIMFVALLFTDLVNEMFGFVYGIVKELSYR